MKLLTLIVIILTLYQFIIFIIVYNYYNTTSQFRCTCKKYNLSFPLSKTSATLINLCLTFSLLTIIRLPKRYIYIPFRIKYLHIYFSVWICIWSIVHSISHYNTFIKFKYPLFLSGIGSTGNILLLLLLSVCIISLPYFRKRIYQYFLYFHYVFLILFTIVIIIHGNLCFLKNDFNQCLNSTSWIWLLSPLLYLCMFTVYKFTKKSKIISFLNCGNNIIELQLELSENYAGKTIWICCPLINYLEWHPFTVCMYKNHRCYLYYKIRGDWTNKFYKTLIKDKEVSLLVEGPYYTLPNNILNTLIKKQVILVSTGIGITPYINLFQNILDMNILVYHLHILVIIKYEQDIQWLLPLIKKMYKKHNVNIKLYFTTHLPNYVLEYIEIPYIFGRPDFNDLLRYNKINNEKTYVYYSGKTSVGREIQKICHKEKLYRFNYVN
jgi:hypothetical protein